MKVVDTRTNGNLRFSQLTHGDTFIHQNEVYMKTGVSKDAITGNIINAILLGLGVSCYFDQDEFITPVKCELHIIE